MNKPKKNIQKKGAAPVAKPVQQAKASFMSERDQAAALLAGVAIVVFICFRHTLHNQFLTNWDDWIYVPKDSYIKAFTAANLHALLFRNITINYYHPITLLSLAVNYYFSQLDPMGYYFTNILLHVVNAILVFYFIKTLMNAMVKTGYTPVSFIPWLGAIGALLHGIHPMHVESVAWLAERKDVLYGIFYFIGMMMYVRYLQGAKFRWMLYLNIILALGCIWGMIGLKDYSLDITFSLSFTAKLNHLGLGFIHSFPLHDPIILMFPFILLVSLIFAEWKYANPKMGMFYVMEFFLLSMFSKPLAVSFPLAMIAVDILLKRDTWPVLNTPGTETLYKIFFNWFFNLLPVSWFTNKLKGFVKLVIEKWAFLIIAVLSICQSFYMQQATSSVAFTNGYTIIQKLLIASYTFTTYIVKAFYPAHLNAFYPFPNLTSSYHLPPVFYAAPLFAAAIVFIPLYLTRKNTTLFRVVLFGLGFYFANVVFILQFLSSGMTIISERYTYLAYFGPLFVVIYFAHWLWKNKVQYRSVIAGVLGAICLTFGYLTSERTKVWHDPETFWTDVIHKTADEYPQKPHFNLAGYYIDSGKFDKAYLEYMTLVRIGSKEPIVFRNLAMIYGIRKQFDSSLYFFSIAVRLDSTDASIYSNRGITYANLGKLDLAMNDFLKSYSLDTSQSTLLMQAAGIAIQLRQYNNAITYCNRLIQKKPQEPSYYMLRGNAYLDEGNPQVAIQDYQHTIQLQPNNGECLYYISFAYHQLKDNSHALQYANMAQTTGFKLPDNYLPSLK